MRQPDRNAPRFRHKYADPLQGTVFVEAFKEKYPQHAKYSNKVLLDTIKKYNSTLCDKIVDERDGVELLSGLGNLFIGITPGTKKPNRGIAWKKSVELGIMVKYKNYETDNKLIKIYYSNYTCQYKFSTRKLWSFTAVRPFKKKASEVGSRQWTRYINVDKYKRIWELFDKRLYRDKTRSRTSTDLKAYNAFDPD